MLQQKMTYAQVQQKVYEIITDFCDRRDSLTLVKPITNKSVLVDFNFDSLHEVELIMEFEKAFDINIPDHIFEECKNVGDFVDCIYNPESFCKIKGIPVVSKYPQAQLIGANLVKTAPDVPRNKPMSSQEVMLKQKLQGTDLSELAGKSFELNGYKITISKVSQRTK